MVATPTADNEATSPTPINSPVIIQATARIPKRRPMVRASVIHMPGVIETKTNVGMNKDNTVKEGSSKGMLHTLKRELEA